MSAGSYDITIEQGATFTRQMTVTQNGSAWNITGYTVRMQIRSDPASSTIILTCSTGSDGRIVLTTPASGIFTITISAATTATLTAGEYVYDLELESASVVTRLLEGRCMISAEVTK